VLHLPAPPDWLADELRLEPGALAKEIETARALLRAARDARPPPLRDDEKILAAGTVCDFCLCSRRLGARHPALAGVPRRRPNLCSQVRRGERLCASLARGPWFSRRLTRSSSHACSIMSFENFANERARATRSRLAKRRS